MQPFRATLRVRHAECDPQGIVFNANYLMYFDVAFTELWREAVGEWRKTEGRGVNLVVADAGLSFHASARFDDELELRSRVLRLGTTALGTGYEVVRDGRLLVSGRLVHVCVSSETWKKVEMPDWIREGMRRFTDTQAEPAAAVGADADAAPGARAATERTAGRG
jgi:acyl-CoA thioester hydrolase